MRGEGGGDVMEVEGEGEGKGCTHQRMGRGAA